MAITNARLYKNEPTATLYNYPAGDGSTDGSTGLLNTEQPASGNGTTESGVDNASITWGPATVVGRMEWIAIEAVDFFNFEDFFLPGWSFYIPFMYGNRAFKVVLRFYDVEGNLAPNLPNVDGFRLNYEKIPAEVVKIYSKDDSKIYQFLNITLQNNQFVTPSISFNDYVFLNPLSLKYVFGIGGNNFTDDIKYQILNQLKYYINYARIYKTEK